MTSTHEIARILALAGLVGAFACGNVRDVSSPRDANEAGDGGARSTIASDAGNSGGQTVIDTEPQPCVTIDGREGLMVDPLPKPPLSLNCEPLAQPGKLDAACPTELRYTCGFDDCLGRKHLLGCCRTEGVCGVWDDGNWSAVHSLGCISREPWIEEAAWTGSPPTPIECTP